MLTQIAPPSLTLPRMRGREGWGRTALGLS
jgi:hypothetical protein